MDYSVEIGINQIVNVEVIMSQGGVPIGGVPIGAARGDDNKVIDGGVSRRERFYWLDNTAILDDQCDVGDEPFHGDWDSLCDKVKRNFKQGTGRGTGANERAYYITAVAWRVSCFQCHLCFDACRKHHNNEMIICIFTR